MVLDAFWGYLSAKIEQISMDLKALSATRTKEYGHFDNMRFSTEWHKLLHILSTNIHLLYYGCRTAIETLRAEWCQFSVKEPLLVEIAAISSLRFGSKLCRPAFSDLLLSFVLKHPGMLDVFYRSQTESIDAQEWQ